MPWFSASTSCDRAGVRMSTARLLLALVIGLLLGAGGTALWQQQAAAPGAAGPQAVPAGEGRAASEDAAIWAISLIRARPGQRERLLRYLRANWLTLDAELLAQGHIRNYRLLEAEAGNGLADARSWDYAVILEYRDRQAMSDFVPAYLALLKARPQVRIEGLGFADLGEVLQQRVASPLPVLAS
jgi:hypothetical protein